MVIGTVLGAVGDVTFGPIITALDRLKETIVETMEFADRAQKASLALGTTYEDTSKSLGGTMEGLRGDLNQKFAAGIAGMEAGLQGNTAGIAKLINQQMLTGTAYQKTAKAFATLEAGLDLSRQDTNNLAASFKLIGNKWEISTDKLVNAMDTLKDTLPSQRLAGMGPGMTQAMAETLGALGPQLMPEFNKVMMAIFDPTVEGAGVLMRLGIGNIRERLGQERDTLVRSKMLMDAIEIAGGRYNKMAEGADKAFFMIDKANQAYGKSGIHFSTLAAAIGDRLARSGNDIADYGATLKNLWKEMWAGFQGGFTAVYPFFLESLKAISSVAKVLGEQFEIFAKSLTGEHGAEKAMFNFKMSILRGAAVAYEKIEFVFDILERFITEGVPFIFNKLQEVFYNVTRPGGMMTQFSHGLTMLTIAMLNAAEFFTRGEADARLKEIRGRAEIRGEELWKEIDDGHWLKKPVLQPREPFAAMGHGDLYDALLAEGRIKIQTQGILHNYKNMMEEKGPDALSPIGQSLKDAIIARENDPKSATLKALHDLIAVNEENGTKAHEDQAENRRERNSLEFLESSANVFGGTVRGILGIDENVTLADLHRTLLEANEQREFLKSKNYLQPH